MRQAGRIVCNCNKDARLLTLDVLWSSSTRAGKAIHCVNFQRAPSGSESIDTVGPWLRLLLGLILVFALFHWSAVVLRSDRGQAGLIVGALVVAAILAVQRVLFRQPVLLAVVAVGLGRPHAKGLAVAGGIGLMLASVVPLFARATSGSVDLVPGWAALVPGLFAQAGVAEETLFRGYLFGHLRRGRSFWRAASVSMLPFVAVHLFLFFTMPWPIALAVCAPGRRDLVPVRASLRIGRPHHLGASAAALRRARDRQDRRDVGRLGLAVSGRVDRGEWSAADALPARCSAATVRLNRGATIEPGVTSVDNALRGDTSELRRFRRAVPQQALEPDSRIRGFAISDSRLATGVRRSQQLLSGGGCAFPAALQLLRDLGHADAVDHLREDERAVAAHLP